MFDSFPVRIHFLLYHYLTYILTDITIRSSISSLTLASFRCYTPTMKTFGRTNRNTFIFSSIFRISLTALFDRSRFHQILIFVYGFEFDLVFRAPRRNVQAPYEFSDLVGLFFRYPHCDGVSERDF